MEEEKETLKREKASFEEKVKKLLAKQKETKEREEKAKEAEEKATAKEERYKELEKTLDERENNVTAKEQELTKREKAAEKTERRAQERTVGYDTEREEYAKKYIDSAKKDLEREIAVLKQEEKVRNQKLDDLEYNYKSLKDDAAYFKEYSQELDKAMVEAKEKLRKQKEKIQKLKETLGATLSGSEGQLDEEQEKPAEVPAEVPEEVQEPEEKKEKKPRGASRKKPENLESPGTHEDKNDPDVTEFATLGYIWEYNKRTSEYRAAREDKKGSSRINNAPIKGKQLWNRVCETYRTHNIWFSDGGDMDAFLKQKENDKIEEAVNRRMQEQGQGTKGGNQKSGDSKGKGQYENYSDDSNWWWTQDNWDWNEYDENSWWNEDQWQQQQQWTPKGKGKNSSKNKGGKQWNK